jgi:hypothetical protein
MLGKRTEELREKRKMRVGQPAKEFIWPTAVPARVVKVLPWLRDTARGGRAKVTNWQRLVRNLKNTGIVTADILSGRYKNY